jgi:anti-sigma regulatory factor (Ser/Thr protein kinase)/putative methionine-R-sulfoxide reductase with GAF domain
MAEGQESALVGGGPAPGAGHVVLMPVSAAALAPERLTDLYRLSDAALSELPLEALMDAVLVRIKEILAVDTVAVLLVDHERDELVARAAKGLEAEVERGVRIPIGRGFAGRIAIERAPISIAEVDRADIVNPILREIGIRSLLGVPLIVEGGLIGVLHVGSLTPRDFTVGDAALLELAAGRVAPGIERARLFDALEQEHRTAVTLQRSLLPGSLPVLIGVEAAARYVPALGEVGGDWYDVIELPRNKVAIVIGDVAGHGVRAAALMAQVRTALRAYAIEGHGPAATLERLDRLMQLTHPAAMVTVGFAVLDTVTGVLRLTSAGHPPPLLVGPGGAQLLQLPPVPPLGAVPFATYVEVERHLAVGETLLLYTDGLVEKRGEPLDVGLDRLRHVAMGAATAPEALCTRVVDRLAVDNEDDVAVVALARTAPPDELVLRLPAERSALASARHQLEIWLHMMGARDAELSAIVLAAGEACANAIEHAYPPLPAAFELRAQMDGADVVITVRDSGSWREPRPSHRGRGLTMMRAAMDDVEFDTGASGTTVVLRRSLGRAS